MKFILEFIAVMTVGVLPHVFAAVLDLINPDYLKKGDQFSVFETLPSEWLSAVASISVVLLVASQQPNGLASIGIRSGKWGANIGAFFIGFFGLSFFVLLYAIAQKILLYILRQPAPPALDTSNPLITSSLRYRDIWERLANLAVLPFSAISEDLTCRGYLVLLLGKLTHTFIPWAIVSLLLTIFLHLYQGKNIRMILLHSLLGIFFIGLTIATQNILATITAHIYFNLVSRLKLWSLAKNQNAQNSIVANSDMKNFVYAVFTVINIFILFVGTVLVLA